MIGGVDAGSVEVLRAVRETGLPCYALTNMEAETYPLRLKRFPFLGWFDGTVVSGREGVAKPEPAIFRQLLDRFGLTPNTTLMIDDTIFAADGCMVYLSLNQVSENLHGGLAPLKKRALDLRSAAGIPEGLLEQIDLQSTNQRPGAMRREMLWQSPMPKESFPKTTRSQPTWIACFNSSRRSKHQA
jgi:haloacid dehalogenase-like hydrolase